MIDAFLGLGPHIPSPGHTRRQLIDVSTAALKSLSVPGIISIVQKYHRFHHY